MQIEIALIENIPFLFNFSYCLLESSILPLECKNKWDQGWPND